MMQYSVVIPAYNAAHTIVESLESVLNQTVTPAQIVVVDDGSSDDTVAVARALSPLITVISQDNQGCGKASSVGISHSTQRLVATLDADDIWLPTKMEKQIVAMRANAEISLIFTKQRQFLHGEPDRGSGEVRDGLNRSSIVFYRTLFDEIGDIIDPPGNRGDLVDWLARAREAGHKFQVLDEVLSLRRIIPGSLSYGRDRSKDRGYLDVARRAMQRRKARENS